MVGSVKKLLKRGRFAAVSALFALSIATAGAATITSPSAAKADSCDPVNIVLCGLDGRSLDSAINSFRAGYNNGGNNGHNDLKAVYRWSGATDASVAGMNSSNTKLGTLYKNGDIKVNGTLVGHDAWVAARFGGGQNGFVEISPGVWARKTTTSFAQASAPVIVHMNANGNADFAVMIGCGNAVKFPPVEQRHPSLSCDNLTKDKVADRKFHFNASASAKDTTITKYVFDFGDGTNDTVRTSTKTASTSHSFAKFDHDYQVRVTVFSSDFANGKTSGNCVLTVHTSPQPVKPALTCDQLAQKVDNQALTYTYTAKATATKTTITSYVFTYLDTSNNTSVTKMVRTSAASASDTHTFAKNNNMYLISVVVNSKDINNVTSASCKHKLTTPPVNQCKPGIPVGDVRCTECVPGETQLPEGCVTTVTPPTTPTVLGASTLTDTGPGSFLAIFGLSSTVGVLVHRFVLRRFLLG
jgi:hypothetical protein